MEHPQLRATDGERKFSIGGPANEYLVLDGIERKSIFFVSGKWPTDVDGVTRIPVCWEDPKPVHASQRGLVESSVKTTWQLYSKIEFQNWSACTAADTHAIHIAVGDYWPQTILGVQIAGKDHGMKLNFDFAAPAEWTGCRSTRDACIKKVAVHEFGHALAFVHEQTRPDTRDDCMKRQPGETKIPEGTPGYTTAGTP